MKFILTNIPNFIINCDYDYNNLNRRESELNEVVLVGGNSGNCMFWESTKKIIQNQTSCRLLNWRAFAENKNKYTDKIKSVVLVFANNINPKSFTQLAPFYHTIKDLDCKKFLFSIGAQNDTLDMYKFSEQEACIYKNFFPHFEYIYLRGKYTYDLLKYNNIPLDNTKEVGCPSILLKEIDIEAIKAKFKKLKAKNNTEIKVGINFPQKQQHEKLHSLFKNIMGNKDVYTLAVDGQSWYDFINYNKETSKFGSKLSKNRQNFIFSNNVFKAMQFFTDKADFMLGTRIHGTILGLCAGLPSMCIAIDSRTYELCKQMNIPYVNCLNETININNKSGIINFFRSNFDHHNLDDLQDTINNNKELYSIT